MESGDDVQPPPADVEKAAPSTEVEPATAEVTSTPACPSPPESTDPPTPAATAVSYKSKPPTPCVIPSTKQEKFDVHELPRSRHMYSHLTSTQALTEHQKSSARSLVRKQEDLLHSLSRIRANLERADIEFENALKLATPITYHESDPTGLRKVARATARERRDMDRRSLSVERRRSLSEDREAIACSDGVGGETLSEPVDEEEKNATDEIGKLRHKIDSLLAKTSYESDYIDEKVGGSSSYLPRYSSVPPLPAIRSNYEVEYPAGVGYGATGGYGASGGYGGTYGYMDSAALKNPYLAGGDVFGTEVSPLYSDLASRPADF